MTLVSHTHDFVFLKTKKTGGSSLEMLLEPYCTPPGHRVVHETTGHVSEYGIVGVRVLPERIAELKSMGRMPHTVVKNAGGTESRINFFSHMPAARVRRAIGRPAWNSYTRITAVRNPFTRAVSLFYYWRKLDMLDPALDVTDTRAAFREFVLSDGFDNDYAITHIDEKPVFHDAFRLEHLQTDIPRISARLDVSLDVSSLAHVKRRERSSTDVPDIELFDSRVTDAIRAKCSWVFDHFDYSTDPEDALL